MKIVMVTPFPLDLALIPGGVAGVSLYLVRALRCIRDVDLEIVVPDSPVDDEKAVDVDGLRVHYLPVGRRSGAARLFWLTARRVLDKLSRLRFDLVHVQALPNLAARSPDPCVLTLHGVAERCVRFRGRRLDWFRSKIVRWVERSSLRKVKNVICISPYHRRFFGSDLRGRTWDVENPIADGFFDLRCCPVPGRIFCGGQVTPLKNIVGLIRAFSQVAGSRPDAELHVAGSGEDTPYGARCRRLIGELGLDGRVRFLGRLTVEQMQAELASAWVLALCSFQETAPLVISEAMAVGVPVVASNICGIPFMVTDGVTGKLVDPNDPGDIARGLGAVLDCPDREAMSAAARKQADDRFRGSRVAQRVVEVYSAILAGGP